MLPHIERLEALTEACESLVYVVFYSALKFLPVCLRHCTGRYLAARTRCSDRVLEHAVIDLTEFAYCIYLNFPHVSTHWPPRPAHRSGPRMRGVMVIAGGDNEQRPPELGEVAPNGGITVDPFELPLNLNFHPVSFTCIFALPTF